MRSWVRACVGIALAMMTALPCVAQSVATPAKHTLETLPGKASAREIASFRDEKRTFLKGFPIGGPSMSGLTKALVLADAGLVDDLVALARDGNALQRGAIGAGLGQAVREIAPVDRALADEIARKIAGSGLADLLAGYSVGQGDVPTLAVSAATAATPASGLSAGFVSGFGAAVPSNVYGNSSRALHNSHESGSTSVVNQHLTGWVRFGGATISCTASVSRRNGC